MIVEIFLSSSTHIGVGNNIDNNSNVAFHIDDINRYGIQVTNSHYAPAINLLYTGGTVIYIIHYQDQVLKIITDLVLMLRIKALSMNPNLLMYL